MKLVLLLLSFTCLLFSQELIQKPIVKAHPSLENLIQSWIKDLEHSKKYLGAAKKIIRIGNIAYPILVESLNNSQSPTQKRRIIEILKIMKNRESIPILKKVLENNSANDNVRSEAATALGFFPDPNAVKTLGKYARGQKNKIYKAAAYALCQMDDRLVIPELIELLKHWDPKVARQAYLKLSKITGEYKLEANYEKWQDWWQENRNYLEDQP